MFAHGGQHLAGEFAPDERHVHPGPGQVLAVGVEQGLGIERHLGGQAPEGERGKQGLLVGVLRRLRFVGQDVGGPGRGGRGSSKHGLLGRIAPAKGQPVPEIEVHGGFGKGLGRHGRHHHHGRSPAGRRGLDQGPDQVRGMDVETQHEGMSGGFHG